MKGKISDKSLNIDRQEAKDQICKGSKINHLDELQCVPLAQRVQHAHPFGEQRGQMDGMRQMVGEQTVQHSGGGGLRAECLQRRRLQRKNGSKNGPKNRRLQMKMQNHKMEVPQVEKLTQMDPKNKMQIHK